MSGKKAAKYGAPGELLKSSQLNTNPGPAAM